VTTDYDADVSCVAATPDTPDAANANPLHGDFLPLRTYVQILSGEYDVKAVHEVPPRVKENVWFLVKC